MNYTNVQKGLIKYDQVQVGIYINYLKSLEEAKDKNTKENIHKWFFYVADDTAVDLYKKVAQDEGLFIDGETITLQYKGRLMVSYNYQAYKNKLLTVYPETLFDLQNVHKGDTFTFKKESGKVIYTHEIKDPFALNKEIIGCYSIIKNRRGEFIEILNNDDITKMRNVAKTQKIWDAWTGEMTLKSVMKRSCKRHFNDLVTNIESLDNQNYDPENVSLDYKISKRIEDADTLEDLEAIYEEEKGKMADETVFMSLLGERKKEIKKEMAT